MKHRCLNPNDPNFDHYGARGITVCERWRDSFAAFIEDMGSRPSSRHTIERVDNSKGYEPGNCEWATMQRQARNKRNNVAVIRDDGVSFGTMVEAAEATGIHVTGIRSACTGKQKTAGGHSWRFADPALLKALTK